MIDASRVQLAVGCSKEADKGQALGKQSLFIQASGYGAVKRKRKLLSL